MFHKERAKSLTEDSTNKIINKNDSSCKTPDFWKKLWYDIGKIKVRTVATVNKGLNWRALLDTPR